VPDYTANLNDSIAGLRIGLPKQYFGEGLDAGVAAVIQQAIAELKNSVPPWSKSIYQRPISLYRLIMLLHLPNVPRIYRGLMVCVLVIAAKIQRT
jgi:hypothetical protein